MKAIPNLRAADLAAFFAADVFVASLALTVSLDLESPRGCT